MWFYQKGLKTDLEESLTEATGKNYKDPGLQQLLQPLESLENGGGVEEAVPMCKFV